jgi:hypothetical protein
MPKKQYPLRLDPELYAILERWAADELRSVNAHIEYLLRDAARRAGRLGKAGDRTPPREVREEPPRDGRTESPPSPRDS